MKCMSKQIKAYNLYTWIFDFMIVINAYTFQEYASGAIFSCFNKNMERSLKKVYKYKQKIQSLKYRTWGLKQVILLKG